MLKKLFGQKKNQDYFLEFEEKSQSSAPSITPEETETAQETTETKGKTEAKTAPITPAPQAKVTYNPPEWVKAIKNYSNQSNGQSAQGGSNTYAGQYVTNNVPMTRRRPGPSLKMFKDLASKMNK